MTGILKYQPFHGKTGDLEKNSGLALPYTHQGRKISMKNSINKTERV
jgi:hypothetical protein